MENQTNLPSNKGLGGQFESSQSRGDPIERLVGLLTFAIKRNSLNSDQCNSTLINRIQTKNLLRFINVPMSALLQLAHILKRESYADCMTR